MRGKLIRIVNFFSFIEIGSPKDWSSDSDSSQQTVLYGNSADANIENMPTSDCSLNSSSTTDELTGKKKKKTKESGGVTGKPSQVVQRRNARERKRVEAVNNAFQNLRKVVPIEENK